MKKLLIVLTILTMNVFAGDYIKTKNYVMTCEDIKDILEDIEETKLIMSYSEGHIVCKALMVEETKCSVIKYELDYRTRKFEVIE